jgi:hypothetical protein
MAVDSLTNALHTVFVTGLSEDSEELSEVETKETGEGTKYKVRVKDRESQSSYVRYATREKIAELRANPNISSVELTDHGTTGEDNKGERTAAAKRGDRDGDGKVESGSKEHAGVVHNAIQRKMGGKPDGQDTRREEFELEEEKREADLGKMKRQSNKHMKDAVGNRSKSNSDSKNKSFKMDGIRKSMERGEDPRRDTYGGKRTGKDGTHPPEDHRSSFSYNMKERPAKEPGVKKKVDEAADFKGSAPMDAEWCEDQRRKDEKSPSSKDRRHARGKFRPGASKEERAEGGRDSMREKGTSPKKNGKKMYEQYLEIRENRRAARAAGGYKDDSKKQTDPSKEGFTGISGSIKDIMKQSAAMDKEKAKKKVETKEEWKPDPKEKRERKSAKLYRDEKLEDGKRSRDRDPDKVKDLYKRRMAVDFKKKKSSIGENFVAEAGESDAGVRSRMKISGYEPPTNWDPEANKGKGATVSAKQSEKRRRKALRKEDFLPEADLVDAGRENQGQRDKKKLTGQGVDNKSNIKLMPSINETVLTDHPSKSLSSVSAESDVNESIRSRIQEMGSLLDEECCPECGTPECVCEGKKEEKPKKKKAKIDESGMPILEYSRNNATGPTPEMINPGKDPEGEPGVMNPKGKPKRYKNKGEAPGDRRPNDPSGPDLPLEKGVVPNGSGV